MTDVSLTFVLSEVADFASSWPSTYPSQTCQFHIAKNNVQISDHQNICVASTKSSRVDHEISTPSLPTMHIASYNETIHLNSNICLKTNASEENEEGIA